MIKSVKIGGIVYDVKVTPNLCSDTVRLNGHIKHDQTLIELDEAMSAQCMKVVLFHEILHGIANQAGIEDDEKMVEVLAFGIVGVLQDNPELVSL